jgi:hypothetical protein
MVSHEQRLERIRGHIKDVHDELQALSPEERDGHEASLARLEVVAAYADAVLDDTDARLVTAPAFGAIQSAAIRISNSPQAALADAEACADALIDAVALIPGPRNTHDPEELERRLQAVRAGVDAQTERLRALGSDVDRWTSEAEQRFRTTCNALDEQATERQRTFEESQRANAAEFRAAIDGFREQFEERAAEIRRMENETATLVETVAVAGTFEHYRRQGRRQRLVAEALRWSAVLATLGAVAVALLATVQSAPTAESLAATLFAAALLVGLAAYFAHQSARHRAREEEAARVQFELAAFSPFIEALTPEQREQERVMMTRKLFGTAPPAAAEANGAAHGFLARRRMRARASATSAPDPVLEQTGAHPVANGSSPL